MTKDIYDCHVSKRLYTLVLNLITNMNNVKYKKIIKMNDKEEISINASYDQHGS